MLFMDPYMRHVEVFVWNQHSGWLDIKINMLSSVWCFLVINGTQFYDIKCSTGTQNLYHNYEKYSLSLLKPRFLVLIEQYLPNISDPVYSAHQPFMWFLWLNWRKSTFYPVTAPNVSKCWPIVTSSIHEPAASNCDVTMTDCSRVVAMDAFLEQWCWGQWFKKRWNCSGGVPWKCKRHYFATPAFQHGASLVFITGVLNISYLQLIMKDLLLWIISLYAYESLGLLQSIYLAVVFLTKIEAIFSLTMTSNHISLLSLTCIFHYDVWK